MGLTTPWEVERVELREATQEVDVWVGTAAGTTFACPQCAEVAPMYDHVERRWRHLDTCQFRTLLCARVPRVRCATHGVTTVRVPWAERGSRFTLLFERLAIAWLKDATPTAVSRRLGLSWDEARGIMERAVRRGLARRPSAPVARLGIDEKSFLKRHQYVSVVVDLDRCCVLHVADDRKTASLTPYFDALTPAQRDGITAVAMDMWEPYRTTVRAHVPDADAKIVFDKFHIMQHVGTAVDTVRKQEHKVLSAAGDTRLTRTKYAWLTNPVNMTRRAWREFAVLRDSTLQSARAWAMKESLRRLWDYTYVGAARTFFRRWYGWAMRSRLEPMKKVARMLQAHLDNILTYLTHRITNAVTEGLNAKIQWIKYGARGYRNRDAFKRAIYFHCGGLDLDPRPS
ncbi:MAG TPA: ISL3 family transposase [Gemmatimonas sp.]|nr:ISL3 family transposase [Gemmatimonas sp.]